MPAPRSRRRIGVLGGTFDPIHNGHLVAASEVAAALNLDLVLFVPAGKPWQKGSITDAEDRYAMTMLATESNPKFSVSRVDIDRPGATYTVDTLRDLQALQPDADLFFIAGADAIASIPSWKDAEQLWALAQFVAVTRPGHPLDLPDAPVGAIRIVEIPALDISSTDVRGRVAAGEPLANIVPAAVANYISEHGLYGEGGQK